MALFSTEPSPARSASAAPDMPAKIMLAATLTCARPPRMGLNKALANANMRSVTPPAFIRLPASTKNGTASRVKRSMPSIIRRGMTLSGISAISRATIVAMPMEMLTGTRSTMSATRMINRVADTMQ